MTPDRRRLEVERFDSAIDQIRSKFPNMRVDVRKEASRVDAEARIPVQPGVAFPMSLSPQNRDELHLGAGHLWLEWFPVGRQDVFEGFVDAVLGLITGNYRIVESYLFGAVVRARLERPNAVGGWETITTWSNLVGLIPLSSRQSVIQNKAA